MVSRQDPVFSSAIMKDPFSSMPDASNTDPDPDPPVTEVREEATESLNALETCDVVAIEALSSVVVVVAGIVGGGNDCTGAYVGGSSLVVSGTVTFMPTVDVNIPYDGKIVPMVSSTDGCDSLELMVA
jgi:hypothetical protein